MNKSDQPDFQHVQHAFTRHLRDPAANPAPEGIEDRRLAIYRRLIFNNISRLLSKNFPVIKKLSGSPRWEELVRDFLRRHQASTPLFPEIGQEFVAFIQQHRGEQAGDPGFLLELAHYEWAETALLLHAEELNLDDYHHQDCNLLNAIPVLSPLAQVLGYQWPVHRINKDFQPTIPLAKPVWLLLHRNRKQRVSFLELQPATAMLCELLSDNRTHTGLQLLQQLAAKAGVVADAVFIDRGHEEMLNLHNKGIIPGTLISPSTYRKQQE